MPGVWDDPIIEPANGSAVGVNSDPIIEEAPATPARRPSYRDDPIVETASPQSAASLRATGQVHDGDTFRLVDGRNARLLGVDAFELDQTGRTRTAAVVPLGREARDTLAPFATPEARVSPSGAVTYGRPVVTIDNDGDPAVKMLHDGVALAEPKYLQGDDARRFDYVDAERDARLNRRGAHDLTYQTPASERAGNPDPVARPGDPNTTAMFWDDPTPYGGLPKDVADGYLAMFQDMRSTPEQLMAYADRNGFRVDPKTVQAAYEQRNKAGSANVGQTEVDYTPAPPRVLTDPKDGAFGASVRGFADPINQLDEWGGVLSSLLPGDRENIWSSDRRFGDIYANNVEQNRSILGYDDANHPWARFGGQLAGGLVVPGGSIEGVGMAAARQVLEAGGTRFAAQQAARNAVLRRLGVAGGIEGGLAGIGQGEDLQSRVLGGAIGAPLGVGLGVGAGVLAPKVASMVGRPFSRLVGREAERTADGFSDGAVDTARAAAQNDLGGAPSPVVPSAAPASAAGRSVIDTAALRAAADTGQGVDMGRAGDVLRGAADDALARGDTVTLHVDGRAIPITKPGMVDDQGQRWGAINLLQPKPGDNARLEITPAGRAADGAEPATAAMASDIEQPTIRGPVTDDGYGGDPIVEPGPRTPDRIDVNARARPLLDPASDMERRAAADRLNPSDVLALPANTVDGVEEAARIERGRYEPVRAPNERDVLERRSYPSANNPDKSVPRVGPADLVTTLRMSGGIKDQGGNLAAAGINNLPRSMDFAGNEARLGKLIDNTNGTPLDEAAHRAWEAGWFPELPEPPSITEFVDRITDTHSGANRVFHPDDWQQVDDFARARDERLGVEQAREEGAPLTRDRSQSVTLDDLDANAAPVKAYEEWGENAPNLAGNIRLDKLDSPQAIKRALVQTERVTGGFDAARRGRITQSETKALASELGMTADDLLKRRKGEAFNAEQALAARQILARSANDLVNIAKRVNASNESGDELNARFREAWLRHAAIQEQVAGMTAEAGRLLSQFRAVADARDALQALPSLGQIPGGAGRIKDVAGKILELERVGTDPAGINRFALKSLAARTKDQVAEFYINGLLSNPQTHAVNMLSNTITALLQVPEHAAAAVTGLVTRPIERAANAVLRRETKEGERVLFSEVGSRAVGLIQGTKEGLAAFARSARTGESVDPITRMEGKSLKAIPGVAGEFIRIPTRLLTAEDELFKGIARRMELNGLAMRMARNEGKRGADATARAKELAANPTDEMMEKAQDYARYLTFQSPLRFMRHFSAAANESLAFKYLVPFVRTPTNLLRFALERSPAAPFLRGWRSDIVAGGARRDLALSRALVGTGVMAMFYEAALAGHITGGGPADREAKRLMMADGWQPYSFKVGDKYYSYRRLDPISTTIGTMADMVDLSSHMTEKQQKKSTQLIIAAIMNNLASKTWLSGVSGAAEAMADPDNHLEDWIAQGAGSIAVPAFVAAMARTNDPIMRDARAPLDRIRSRVPGLSSDLYARRDAFGREIVSEGGVGPDIVSPIFTSTAKNDPTIKALIDAGAHITAPKRTIKENGVERDMTPAEYDRYAARVGELAKPELDALVASPEWGKVTDKERRKAVVDTMRWARGQARADTILPNNDDDDAEQAWGWEGKLVSAGR